MRVRTTSALLLAGNLLAGTTMTGAAGAPARVSLQLQGTPLRTALARLPTDGAPPVVVDPTVPDVSVSVSVAGVPWTTALRAIVRAASGAGRTLDLVPSGEGYRVGLRALPMTPVEFVAPTARPLFMNRGSVSFKNAPLRQVLRRIAAETQVRTQVDPKVEDAAVTVSLYRRPASELVAAALEAAGAQSPGLRYVWDGDRYVIWKCPHGYAGTRRPGDDGSESELAAGQRLERLALRYASVYQLSDLLGAGVFGSSESQLGPVNNLGGGGGLGEIVPPGQLPPGPDNAFLPTIDPPVLTGLCRYARCGPRFAREADTN